jgi:adenosylcobinamide amidohydrolase
MDIESHESAMLLKESSSRRRQGLALKLAVVLCGLGLLVNLTAPMGKLSAIKEEKVTSAAAAGVSSTSRAGQHKGEGGTLLPGFTRRG